MMRIGVRLQRTRRLLAALAIGGSILVAAPAHAGDTCVFGGTTPGYKVVRLDLPQGSDFVSLGFGGRNTSVVTDEDSWHLAIGVMIVNASNLKVEAWWLGTSGWTPPYIQAEVGGQRVRQAIPAPDGPFADENGHIPPTLAPGTYYGIGFGVGVGEGDLEAALGPNEWRGSISVRADNTCDAIAEGETFDINQTDFEGGTQVNAPGVGLATNASYSFTTTRNLVVGLISAEVIGPPVGRDMGLSYTTPTGGGSFAYKVQPFASTSGTYRFNAHYRGIYPEIVIAGISVTV